VAQDFAVDPNFNVYVLSSDYAEDGVGAVSVFPPNSTTPSRVIMGAATQLAQGYVNGLAVASDGSVAVNMTTPQYNFPDPASTAPGEILIFGPSANGNVAPARVISGSATGLSSFGIALGEAYVAWLPDGSIAASDLDVTNPASIRVFAAGASGNVAPARVIAGGATGIGSVNSSYALTNAQPTMGTTYATNGIAADNAGRIYVALFGSSLGLPAQIVRFDAGANGNVVPSAVLAGPLTGLRGPGKVTFASAAITPVTNPVPSISGDFFALAPNRGWNYSVTPAGNSDATPAPSLTVTLYDEPQQQSGDSILVALETQGSQTTATTGSIAGYGSFNNATGGYTATGYYSVSNFAGGPIPGGMQIVLPSLTKGQSWSPYPGLTATVLDVGTVIGSAPCPGGSSSIGATVLYSSGYFSEKMSFVPGCGITHLVDGSGAQFVLTSIGSYPTLGELAEARKPASLAVTNALRAAWKNVWAPWHP
jgi:hypothetical protein